MKTSPMFTTQASKAYVAAAIAGLGAAAVAAADGITLAEAIGIASTALVAFQGTYWVTNTPTPAQTVPGPPWAWHGADGADVASVQPDHYSGSSTPPGGPTDGPTS